MRLELMTDASGGAGTPADPGHWGAALGQRRGPTPDTNLAAGFQLLLVEGGSFNAKQAAWDILKKEAKALILALQRMRMFIYGCRITVIVDSKVLMHIFRSTNPMLQRWHAFLQTFDFEMKHIPSEENSLADCISRYTAIAPPAQDAPLLLRSINRNVPAVPLTQQGVESNPGPLSNNTRHR
jgi:hypothetical protein